MLEAIIQVLKIPQIFRKSRSLRPRYDSVAKRFDVNQELHHEDGSILHGKPRLLTKKECPHILPQNLSTTKKWWTLSVIFIIQVSMNFNAAVYGNANMGISKQFNVSEQAARTGQALFLIFYAVGSELWAPWSEELGRWPILQSSLFFVNIFQLPVALAPNFATVVIGRILGGLSSAGGSVTLGMINDMYSIEEHGYAVNYIVLSSVGGSVVGPIVGAFIEAKLATWRWIFWISAIFGGAVQILHCFGTGETSPERLMDREARRLRREKHMNVWGPGEVKASITIRDCMRIWARPFIMFVNEPIVLLLSLLSGFSDALIFTFIEAFNPVYKQYGFGTISIGLVFLSLLVGYFIAFLFFIPFIRKDIARRRSHVKEVAPESRLIPLLYTAPCLTIGLFGFAWTSQGPPQVPWIAPVIFSAIIGIANAAIYMATIDYMIASYGPYAASATGGNALARDALSGVAAYYSTPFYSHFAAPNTLTYPSTILACIALFFTVPVYVFYIKGPKIRQASKFAQTLANEGKDDSLSDNNSSNGEPEKFDRIA